jgi:hypothetical protein
LALILVKPVFTLPRGFAGFKKLFGSPATHVREKGKRLNLDAKSPFRVATHPVGKGYIYLHFFIL